MFNINTRSNLINDEGEVLEVDEYNNLDEDMKINKNYESEQKTYHSKMLRFGQQREILKGYLPTYLNVSL